MKLLVDGTASVECDRMWCLAGRFDSSLGDMGTVMVTVGEDESDGIA